MTDAAATLARCLATALDADDFNAAMLLLAPDCEYLSARGVIVGPAAIIASYRGASAWAKSALHSVTYGSSVRSTRAGIAVITFTDELLHNSQRHRYTCEQEVHINRAELICRIVHHELVGQREALNAFLLAVGVIRSSPPAGAPYRNTTPFTP